MPRPDYSSLETIIVGAGLMGHWHAYYARQAGVRISAVVDPDKKAAKSLARQHRGAISCGDINELLDSQATRIWHICTPPALHLSLAQAAISSGAHVLVEKPLAGSSEDTETLLLAASAAGVQICPVHQFPFQDGVEKALTWMPAHIRDMLHFRFRVATAGAEGLNDTQRGCVVSEILPHPLSLLSRLWPDTPFDCDHWQSLCPAAGELRLQGLHGNIDVSINISTHARPTRAELELTGTLGSLYLDLFHGFGVFQHGEVSRGAKIIQPFSLAAKYFTGATANMFRRALSREPAYPGLRRLLLGFYTAVVTGTLAPISPQQVRAEAQAREQLLRNG